MEISNFLMDYLSKDQLKDFLRSFDLKVSGNKDELIERLIHHEEFNFEEIPDFLYKEELQEICEILGLSRAGNKSELWSRIIQDIGGIEKPIIANDTRTAKVTVVAEVEEIEEHVDIEIYEIKAPEKILVDSTSFQIDIILQNNGKTDEVIQIWHHAIWNEGGMKTEPLIKLESNQQHCEELILQTPSKEGNFKLIIKLLDSGGVFIKDQKAILEFEVKMSGKNKILKWGKAVGKIILTRI